MSIRARLRRNFEPYRDEVALIKERQQSTKDLREGRYLGRWQALSDRIFNSIVVEASFVRTLRDGGLRPFALRRARNKFLRASSLHRTRFAGPILVETAG